MTKDEIVKTIRQITATLPSLGSTDKSVVLAEISRLSEQAGLATKPASVKEIW